LPATQTNASAEARGRFSFPGRTDRRKVHGKFRNERGNRRLVSPQHRWHLGDMSLIESARNPMAKLGPPRRSGARVRRNGYTSRDLFLDACRCEATGRPPIWMMRQAGRCLPEYRALKEKHSFLELVRTPELAAEVTLQPIRRFGFDAAILFSDILVVPEAMGQGYRFRDSGGIEMDFTLHDASDIERLTADGIAERLQYVAEALQRIRPALGGRAALLGFAGSPWTLANFMLEGGSSKQHTRALDLLIHDRPLFDRLMEKLTRAVTAFLQMQIVAGVDAIQLFDSHGGELPPGLFSTGSGEWLRRIISEIDDSVPVIVFSKGTRDWNTLLNLGADVIGIDHHIAMEKARTLIPDGVALQGNLDPQCLVQFSPKEVTEKTQCLLETMRGRPGYIFNLGHGVPPGASLESISAVVQTVRRFHDIEGA
jgi:uroporphyrinogen decarboxylase